MSPRQADQHRIGAGVHEEAQLAVSGKLLLGMGTGGLATRTCSCVVAVGKAEYDARTAENPLHLPEHFGFKQHQPSALERARRAK